MQITEGLENNTRTTDSVSSWRYPMQLLYIERPENKWKCNLPLDRAFSPIEWPESGRAKFRVAVAVDK